MSDGSQEALAGTLIGMGLALVRRQPAPALERPEQVEEELELPVIAVLPERLGGVRP